MELNQPLNQAHYFQRQAEKFVLRGQLDQALIFFQKAANFFDRSFEVFFKKSNFSPPSNNSNIDDSGYSTYQSYLRALTYIPKDCYLTFQTILEQKDFCRRQADILKSKISNKSIMEEKKKKNDFENLSNLSYSNVKLTDFKEDFSMKGQIFRHFDRHDTLLQELGFGGPLLSNGAKIFRQKNDQNLIEELENCNQELRKCILNLFDLLDEKNREIERLKLGKIDELDRNFRDKMNFDDDQNQESTRNSLELYDLPPRPDLIMDFTPLELPEYKPPVLP